MAKRKHKVGDLIMYTYVSSDTTNAKHDLGVITKIVNGIDGLVDGTTRYYVDWFDGLKENIQYGDEQIVRMKELLRERLNGHL